ncbi:MAG: DUF2147 domain-containing protein [Deltaproteobacteria bacterium]|nr:DUF2147 domain-containing protein [Deltaproteobacteria bacterium]
MITKIIKVLLIGLLAAAPIVTYAEHEEFLGLWQTIDDDTNKPRSVVEVYLDNGQLKGNIVKLFPQPGEVADPVCDQCKNDLHNKKIIGMQIINDMEYKKGIWKNGEILDPNNGKFYDCKIWLEDNKLKVRGYIGFFFRTQEWLRFKENN